MKRKRQAMKEKLMINKYYYLKKDKKKKLNILENQI